MKRRCILLSAEPDIERVCAAAMRSCYSPYPASTLYMHSPGRQLSIKDEKVLDKDRVTYLIGKALELGHLDVLEHGSFIWLVEAKPDEILSLIDKNRFISFSRLNGHLWILSANPRILVELVRSEYGEKAKRLVDDLLDSVREAVPTIWNFLLGRKGEASP